MWMEKYLIATLLPSITINLSEACWFLVVQLVRLALFSVIFEEPAFVSFDTLCEYWQLDPFEQLPFAKLKQGFLLMFVFFLLYFSKF
jgi:hypothetical protein